MRVYMMEHDADGPKASVAVNMAVSDEGDVEMRPLDLRRDLKLHSPDGIAWGDHGGEAAQLALAILADATGDEGMALVLHQDFKRRVVAAVPRDEPWAIDANAVRAIAGSLQRGG